MSASADTAGIGRGTLATDLKRGGHAPSGPPMMVLPPLVIALERWVNEGGSGNDPDSAAQSSQAQITPHRKNP